MNVTSESEDSGQSFLMAVLSAHSGTCLASAFVPERLMKSRRRHRGNGLDGQRSSGWPRRALSLAKVLLPGGTPYLGPPKTTAGYRTVPLADVVLEALAAHLKSWPATTAFDERGRPSELVCSDNRGRPVSRTTFIGTSGRRR
jgi:hypothetical protein